MRNRKLDGSDQAVCNTAFRPKPKALQPVAGGKRSATAGSDNRHAGRAIPRWNSFKSTETGIAAFEFHPRAVSVSINGDQEFKRFSQPMHAL